MSYGHTVLCPIVILSYAYCLMSYCLTSYDHTVICLMVLCPMVLVLLSYIQWPYMIILSCVLWSRCHMSYGLMSYGPTVLYPMAILSYCHPMVLQLYVLLSYSLVPAPLQSYGLLSLCHTVLCCVLQS